MKRITYICISTFSIMTLIGCFPKASEVIRALPVESKEQILTQYNSTQLNEGQAIFVSHCGKCHKLPEPASKNPEQWNKILKRMIPKAKLSDDQGKLVRAYLIANSKEG